MVNDAPRHAPSHRDFEDRAEILSGPLDVRSVALTGLFLLAVFYTLYFARTFLVPMVLAVLLTFLLSPLVRALRRLWIPDAVAAALVLVSVLGAVGYGFYRLGTPAATWIATAPESLRRVDSKLRAIRKPVEQVSKAAAQVENLATVNGGSGPPPVEVKTSSLSDTILTQTQGILAGAAVMIIFLYFLLASGDLFLRKLVRLLPTLADKKVAVEIARQIEDHISRYLLTITAINVGLGTTVAVAMWVIGMPNPVLWGVMVAIFNFVPYVGPLTSLIVLAMVGITTFDSLGQAFIPPLVYFAIDALESNVLTPMVLGHRLALNPVVIFIAVIFWGWLWGIVGALLAVPMLAAFKIFCDAIEPLAPIGEFLGNQ
jgi:predicted PurR-regulated permease PerM